jgi:hypothetical protein
MRIILGGCSTKLGERGKNQGTGRKTPTSEN